MVHLLSFIIRLEAEYWIYSTGQFRGVHAFGYNSGYNSAESEPIGMKSRATQTLSTLLGAGHGRFWARSAQ